MTGIIAFHMKEDSVNRFIIETRKVAVWLYLVQFYSPACAKYNKVSLSIGHNNQL